MNWQEILTILIPILGLMGWVYARIEKKLEGGFAEIKEELRLMRQDIHQLDMRLTRLEGRFDERGYWESQIKIIKDNDLKEK